MFNQTKIIWSIAVLFLALGAVLVIFEPQPQPSVGNADPHTENVLTTNGDWYDFEQISMKAGNVKTTYALINDTERPLTLNKIYTSCMCTEATLKINGAQEGPFGMPGHGRLPTFNQILEPGQEAQLEVEFDPASHGPAGLGVVQRFVIIEGPEGHLATLGFQADVAP
jgi:hypothetical protein